VFEDKLNLFPSRLSRRAWEGGGRVGQGVGSPARSGLAAVVRPERWLSAEGLSAASGLSPRLCQRWRSPGRARSWGSSRTYLRAGLRAGLWQAARRCSRGSPAWPPLASRRSPSGRRRGHQTPARGSCCPGESAGRGEGKLPRGRGGLPGELGRGWKLLLPPPACKLGSGAEPCAGTPCPPNTPDSPWDRALEQPPALRRDLRWGTHLHRGAEGPSLPPGSGGSCWELPPLGRLAGRAAEEPTVGAGFGGKRGEGTLGPPGQILPGQCHLGVDVLLGASAGAGAPAHGVEGKGLLWLDAGGGAGCDALAGLGVGVEAQELLVLGVGGLGGASGFAHPSVGTFGSCSVTVQSPSRGQGAGLGWERWGDAGSLGKRRDRTEVRAGSGSGVAGAASPIPAASQELCPGCGFHPWGVASLRPLYPALTSLEEPPRVPGSAGSGGAACQGPRGPVGTVLYAGRFAGPSLAGEHAALPARLRIAPWGSSSCEERRAVPGWVLVPPRGGRLLAPCRDAPQWLRFQPQLEVLGLPLALISKLLSWRDPGMR